MNKTKFLFGIHCHQPVENFYSVVEDAVEKCYKPFFDVISRYENFSFSVHFSGWLLEFIEKNSQELFEKMQDMAKKGQIEFFSGGFYEPVLSAIPSKDRIDQIKKLNTYIKKHFYQQPRGLWLTERVWDSSIVNDLIKCGIEYLLLDDYHFVSTGFEENNLNGYYLSENNGETIALFPINKTLRYIMPFKESNSVCKYLEDMSEKESEAAILFDDGEKFGLWPKTYEWIYEKGWLESFIQKVLENEKIESMCYSDYFDNEKAIGLAYLPPYSYYEMGEWSLKAKDAIKLEAIKDKLEDIDENEMGKFVKGSIWKNFFVKYYESNHIHKRTLELSSKRAELKSKIFNESLFKAQTNDVLWHGVFGGLYLPNLRDNAYRFIIEAENCRYDKNTIGMEINDFNMDGYDDIKFVNKNFIYYIDSAKGAQISELSLRDKLFNLQNTLTRYEEAYHDKIITPAAEKATHHSDGIDTIHNVSHENLEEYRKHLNFDWYAKNSFIDHISDSGFNIDDFKACIFKEHGDFANQPFMLKSSSDTQVDFRRDGGVYVDGIKYDTSLNKEYSFLDNGFKFDIDIDSEYEGELTYVLEINFHFANIKNVTFNLKNMEDGSLVFKNCKKLTITDPYVNKSIHIALKQSSDVICCEINSVSQNESGFELTNQGVSIGFVVSYKKRTGFSGMLKIDKKV